MYLKISYLILVLTLTYQCQGQNTTSTLDYNNVSATINNFGTLFTKPSTTSAGYEVPKGAGAHIIYSSSFWFGGQDNNGQIYVCANRFVNYGPDLYPGPISNDYNLASYQSTYNSIWTMTKSEVINHINNFSQVGYSPSQNILNWPGNGNTSNGEAAKLAPYVDANNNGTYDPINGDYPNIRGDEAQFFIVNDDGPHQSSGGNNMKLEIHFMLYQYASNNYLNNTTFINLHVFNRSQTTYHNFKVANYVDHDIGSSVDDYTGCSPENNMIFGYNGDNDDNTSGGVQYGLNPPAVGIKLLNHTMGVAGYYNNAGGAQGDPNGDLGFWNFMNATWSDGTHFTEGGSGYGGVINTNYLYPGHPTDQNSWNETTENNVPADRRMYMVANSIGSFSPGESVCYDFAVLYSKIGDHLQNAANLYNLAGNVQAFYNAQDYTSCNANYVSVDKQNLESSFKVYPNPTVGSFKIDFEGEFDLELYNLHGQKLFTKSKMNSNQTVDIELVKGIYIANILQNDRQFFKKLIVE